MAKNTLTTDDARDQHGTPTGLLEQANDVFDDMVAMRRDSTRVARNLQPLATHT
jgi:hypothetical protein